MMSLSLKSKVLVAMSGGVDSCVAAALLAEQGYDVVGITMRVVADEAHQSVFKRCCSIEMAKDARQVADLFGFPHHTINYVEEFDDLVIRDFEEEYLEGRTPNPCIRCNQRLKFGSLYKKAIEMDAAYIATGHYVRVLERGDRFAVQKAVHGPKDQSYVMAGLSQRQLGRSLFPLGEMTKEETREKARQLGLAAAETPESQDICFIPDNDYRGFLRKRIGATAPGPILSTAGEHLGEHDGLVNFTIGQRHGLGIGGGSPYYVVRLDRARNAVIAGRKEDTYCDAFTAKSLVWGGLAPQEEPFECRVQIRYRHTPVPCTAVVEKDTLTVTFGEPGRAVTPGQWAVLYDEDDVVLAAGIIADFSLAESVALEPHGQGASKVRQLAPS